MPLLALGLIGPMATTPEPWCSTAPMIPSRYLGGDFVVVARHGFELLAQFWIGF